MLDEAFDVTINGGKRFDIKPSFRDDLLKAFPDETDAINGYFAEMARQQAAAAPFFLGRLLDCLLPWGIGGWFRRSLGRKHLEISDQTLASVLDRLTDNIELKGLLGYLWGDHGLPPGATSFAVHSMVRSSPRAPPSLPSWRTHTSLKIYKRWLNYV